MLFKKILVVLEPNKEKQYALERAVRLVKEQNNPEQVEITVFMTVYDVAYEMSELLSSDEGHSMKESIIQQRYQEIEPLLKPYNDPRLTFNMCVLWHSNEADAISELVANDNFDLVVKYTNAQDEGLSALIFTPQDWQLLRKCETPIMMVRNNQWKHQRRILVAVNVGDEEESQVSFNHELVELGMHLADTLERGNVHLVSAYPPSAINLPIDMPEFSSQENTNEEFQRHHQQMTTLREAFEIDEDHIHLLEGFPEEVIPEVAKNLEAEIVVLGTVGRQGLVAALLGNTAEHVISKLHCNLLTIKPSEN